MDTCKIKSMSPITWFTRVKRALATKCYTAYCSARVRTCTKLNNLFFSLVQLLRLVFIP